MDRTSRILGGALVAAGLAIAFLLGRESGRAQVLAELSRREAPTPLSLEAPSRASERGAPAGEVAGYLAAVDAIAIGPAGGDASGFAQELLASALAGDPSKLDAVAREVAAAEAKVAAMTVPPAAAAHHAALLAQIRGSRALLTKLSGALARKDPGALAALAADAERLQASADRLSEAEKALRGR